MPPYLKKIRFWVRFTIALIKKYYSGFIISAIAGTLSFFVLPQILQLLPKTRTTKTIAVVGRFTQADIPISIQQQISLGLTTLTHDGRPAPALAKSWVVSEDGKTYTFDLDTGFRWHDGSPLQSRDIDYGFRDITIQSTSSNQLTIRLAEPFSPLPAALSRPLFKITKKRFLFFSSSRLLGLGNYHIGKIIKNGQFIQSLFLLPTSKQSDLPNLKYIFYPTENMATTAFKLGLVNSVLDLQQTPAVLHWPRVQIHTNTKSNRYVGLFFNTSNQLFSGTSGKNLRLALAYAIDKTRWSNRAFGPLNPSSWYYKSELKSFDQDIAKAIQLLSKQDKRPEKITISSSPANLSVAEAIKTDWKAVGIDADIITTTNYLDNFSVVLLTQAIPADPDQYNLWHSTQTTNITRLNDPRVDILLERGRQTVGPTQRREIYHEFQRFLVDDVPAIFLFHPVTYSVSR